MTDVLRDVWRTFRTWPIFVFYVVATLVVAGVVGLITFDVIDLGMTHFGQLPHRTHDVTYGMLFTTGVVGVLAQVRRPERNAAGMVMALIPVGGLLMAGILSGDVDAVVRFNPLRYAAWVTVVAVLTHPAWRAFLASFHASRINWTMLGMVGVAAVPLLALGSTNIRLQRTAADVHGFMGHYGFTASFSFTVIAVGLLASLRPDGWRLTAWVAGLLPALLGVTSMLYPDATSSLGPAWSFAAIAWGVTFVAVAVLANEEPHEAVLDARDVSSRTPTHA